jgi:hypothetical protein
LPKFTLGPRWRHHAYRDPNVLAHPVRTNKYLVPKLQDLVFS